MAHPVASIPSEGIHLETTPLRFRKILVPLNLAAPSVTALDTAIQIGGLYDAEVLVTYASSLPARCVGQGFVAREFLVDEIRDSRKRLEQIIVQRPNAGHVHTHTLVEFVNPVSMVRQLTETYAPDLIVMGSHGASGAELLAVGSVAQSVVYALTTPVLIMGPAAAVPNLPFRSVVLATDLSTADLRAAQYAASLCESFLGDLTLLHIIENAPKDLPGRRSLEATVRQELGLLVPTHANLCAHADVQFGDPAEEILKMANSTDASLLVMAAKRGSVVADHAPWGTLSKVIHRSPCGVLVIRGHLA